MRDTIRNALAISAVLMVVMYWLASDKPLDQFEFLVLQMLAMLVVMKAIEKRRIG